MTDWGKKKTNGKEATITQTGRGGKSHRDRRGVGPNKALMIKKKKKKGNTPQRRPLGQEEINQRGKEEKKAGDSEGTG